MTSSPLFIIEAESMVIFWPMLQFGCFSACASVACSMSAAAQVRNGPPDAVMMTRTSSSRLPELKRLKQRVVLGIGRQDAGARLRSALHEEIAGADQAFLVGKRDRRAAIDGRQRRLQPGRAADRGHHPVGRPRRRLDDRAFARAAFGAACRQAHPSVRKAARDRRRPQSAR